MTIGDLKVGSIFYFVDSMNIILYGLKVREISDHEVTNYRKIYFDKVESPNDPGDTFVHEDDFDKTHAKWLYLDKAEAISRMNELIEKRINELTVMKNELSNGIIKIHTW